jgi:hypothetical protein
MKQKRLAATVAAVTAALWIASAQAATPSPEWLGTWELDVSKSQQPPSDPAQPPPRSVTVTVKDLGGGKWSMQRVTVLADGKTEEAHATISADGAPSPLSGDPRFDSGSTSFPDSHTQIVILSKAGKQVQKLTMVLSADGKHRTQTTDSTDRDGKAVHSTSIWNKK